MVRGKELTPLPLSNIRFYITNYFVEVLNELYVRYFVSDADQKRQTKKFVCRFFFFVFAAILPLLQYLLVIN